MHTIEPYFLSRLAELRARVPGYLSLSIELTAYREPPFFTYSAYSGQHGHFSSSRDLDTPVAAMLATAPRGSEAEMLRATAAGMLARAAALDALS